MPIYALDGVAPDVAGGAFIAPTAVLIGAVTVEAGASVWYGAVVRADTGSIVIRAGANVQDNSVLHSGRLPTEIGARATVGHLCLVHGADVGAEALIGNGSTVLDGARIGARCLLAAHSLVLSNAAFEPDTFIAGVPAVAKGPVTAGMAALLEENPVAYEHLARRYGSGLQLLD